MSNAISLPKGLSFTTKQSLVYHAVREAIMAGRVAPGERLVIADIARRLDVSQIPVREALQMLLSEHLVEHRPHAGMVVAALSEDDAREIFALLEALESAAFAHAVHYVTAQDLKQLAALVEKMAATTDDARWMELNHRFHRAIAEIARMPRLLEMLERVTGEWERLRRHRFREAGHPDTAEPDREHRQMIDALAAKDVPALERLVRAHNRAALAFYVGTSL